MKLRQGLALHDVCGNHFLVAQGIKNIDFNNVIAMNDSSLYLWKAVKDKEFTVDNLVNLILEEYEVDRDTAQKDCETLMKEWKEAGIIVD